MAHLPGTQKGARAIPTTHRKSLIKICLEHSCREHKKEKMQCLQIVPTTFTPNPQKKVRSINQSRR